MPVIPTPQTVFPAPSLPRPMSRRLFLLKAAAGLALPLFGRSPALGGGRAALPAVDRAAPSVTETATFAMG